MPSALRQAYKLMDKERYSDEMARNQNIEINPSHELIISLNSIRKENPELASEVLHQIYDNALITADILENFNPSIKRMNSLMLKLLQANKSS